MTKISKEQIAKWKAKYGDVFMVEVEGKKGYLRKPDRKVLSYAFSKGQHDPLAMSEVILTSCWLEGDEELRTDDSYFLAINTQIDQLVEIKTAEIKKL